MDRMIQLSEKEAKAIVASVSFAILGMMAGMLKPRNADAPSQDDCHALIKRIATEFNLIEVLDKLEGIKNVH